MGNGSGRPWAQKEYHAALEKPLLEKQQQVIAMMDALKEKAKPLVESQRKKSLDGSGRLSMPRGNEETFPPVTARFVRMTILATTQESTAGP